MILDKIKSDQIEARKGQNTKKAVLLSTLISEIEMIGKNARREISNNDSITCLNKFKKGVVDTLELLKKGAISYPERRTELELELNLYNSYLPKSLTEAELESIILKMVSDGLNMKDIMSKLKLEYAGQYDGKLASELVKRLSFK